MKFSEKYRPETISEIIGQDRAKQEIRNLIARGVFFEPFPPALLLIGTQGSGKTTFAYCLARELFKDEWRSSLVEMNASDERRIDDVRGKIKTLSQTKGLKILLLDEADNMGDDAQQALRRTMELTKSTIFILTGNNEAKLIDPIKSRCVIFRFKRLDDRQIMKRLLEVCQTEKIEVDEKSRPTLIQLVKDSYGDLRAVYNNLERLINEKGEITVKALVELEKPKMAVDAMNLALNGKFEDARKKMEDSIIIQNFSHNEIIAELYAGLSKIPDGDSRVWLYSKLAETETALRYGGTPVIQLVSFLADCYVANHVELNCIKR